MGYITVKLFKIWTKEMLFKEKKYKRQTIRTGQRPITSIYSRQGDLGIPPIYFLRSTPPPPNFKKEGDLFV